MKHDRCINIDWLEVYAREPSISEIRDAAYFENRGIRVSIREYGTRVYKQMFTIYDEHDNPVIEVRREPASIKGQTGGVFDETSCHLRLTNYACYLPDPVGLLRRFMSEHGYILVRIFRIDIALDFTQFDKGDDPMRFMKRYIDGKYSKVNQTNIHAHGVDRWDGRTWQSLSWGAPSSMVGTKFYNKTAELAQVKDKPYIRWAWYLAGLVTNPLDGTYTDEHGNVTTPVIWRLEFSIKSSAKRWYKIEDDTRHKSTEVFVPHSLECYDTKERLLYAFACLSRYYFHFKHYDPTKRKDRCDDKVLFVWGTFSDVYRVTGNVAVSKKATIVDKLCNLLTNYKMMQTESSVIDACQVIIDRLQDDRISQFVGTGSEIRDRLALQRLLSDAIRGCDMARPSQHLNEVTRMIDDFAGEVF